MMNLSLERLIALILIILLLTVMYLNNDLRNRFSAKIDAVRTELKADIADLRTELKADIANARMELSADIQHLDDRLFAIVNPPAQPEEAAP